MEYRSVKSYKREKLSKSMDLEVSREHVRQCKCTRTLCPAEQMRLHFRVRNNQYIARKLPNFWIHKARHILYRLVTHRDPDETLVCTHLSIDTNIRLEAFCDTYKPRDTCPSFTIPTKNLDSASSRAQMGRLYFRNWLLQSPLCSI